MMLGEYDSGLQNLLACSQLRELADEQVIQEELLAQPHRDRHREALEAIRRKGDVSFKEPLELQQRLVVERDDIDAGNISAGLLQALRDRVLGEARVVV